MAHASAVLQDEEHVARRGGQHLVYAAAQLVKATLEPTSLVASQVEDDAHDLQVVGSLHVVNQRLLAAADESWVVGAEAHQVDTVEDIGAYVVFPGLGLEPGGDQLVDRLEGPSLRRRAKDLN